MGKFIYWFMVELPNALKHAICERNHYRYMVEKYEKQITEETQKLAVFEDRQKQDH